jgi:carboxymethylenebutenolidase
MGRALWAEERDLADEATLASLAAALGLPVPLLAERAAAPDTRMRYDMLTQEAIDRGVFGAPTYVLRGEVYWGQDRLDFVGRALAQ